MKNVGIIAEYNPFHNGHQYQIEEIRRRTHASRVIVAMSGDFVQRGAPALIDKYARTRMALTCGVDLVLELPVLWATASAEDFAMAGVTLLDQTGCVDVLCFGAETDDLPLLQAIADLLVTEPEPFRTALVRHLKNGKHYPAARAAAVRETLKTDLVSDDVLKNPNNILAIEYLKALKRRNSSMKPYLIRREGAGFHEDAIQADSFSSASAIRAVLLRQKHDDSEVPTVVLPEQNMIDAMPSSAYAILSDYLRSQNLVDSNDFSSILNYLLLAQTKEDYARCSDLDAALAARMEAARHSFSSFDAFCSACKTRDVTYTRVSRALTHLLLGITDDDIARAKQLDYIPYLRILGLKKNVGHTALRKHAALPLVAKLADARKQMSPDALWMLEKDVFASDLYATVSGAACRNEYQKSPIIL
jgi:predicted nucleotidyltransferase